MKSLLNLIFAVFVVYVAYLAWEKLSSQDQTEVVSRIDNAADSFAQKLATKTSEFLAGKSPTKPEPYPDTGRLPGGRGRTGELGSTDRGPPPGGRTGELGSTDRGPPPDSTPFAPGGGNNAAQ